MTDHGDTVREALNQLTDHGSQKCLDCLKHRQDGMDALAALERERDEATRDLLWERTEHDKARTEWLLMRDRLNGLIETVENAISTTEPPSGYDEPWCNYEDEIEAAPWAWLQTLLGEALEHAEKFDEESWEIEASLRREDRANLVSRAEAAERERDTLREALEGILSPRRAHMTRDAIRESLRAALASVRDEQAGSAPPPGYVIPVGDERCSYVMDACVCMKRKGHDGLHACAHGGWRSGAALACSVRDEQAGSAPATPDAREEEQT